jgi:hypothetical protein
MKIQNVILERKLQKLLILPPHTLTGVGMNFFTILSPTMTALGHWHSDSIGTLAQ